MTAKREAQRRRYIENLVANCSDRNRPTIAAYIKARSAEGLATSTLINTALALSYLDNDSAGTPILQLTPDELTNTMVRYAATRSPEGVDTWRATIKKFYSYHNGDEVPGEIRKALRRKPRSDFQDVEPLSDSEFQALLDACRDDSRPAQAARRQAILWTLWDSGFRIGELLSLQVGSLVRGEQGTWKLRLPPRARSAYELKTGPRAITVVECAPSLQVWLGHHPQGTDPQAPLFPASRGALRPMGDHSINAMLKRLADKAQIRHVWPHLFRHTRATRAARTWRSEAKLRLYFGWSRNSPMPARYIHLAERDMEDTIRREAGIDQDGKRTAIMATDEDLDRILRRRLKKLLLEDE